MQLRPYQLKLVEDTSASMRTGHRRICMVLGCGGGKSVIAAEMAKRSTDKQKRVLFLVHRKELCDQISRTFISYGVPRESCQVMMVQTACRRTGKLQAPDLILIDECHHALAKSYLKILEAFPNAYCVGITATPQRMGTQGLGRVFETLVEGPSVKWLIDNHHLAPFAYYSPSVADLSGMRVKSGDYLVEDIEARMIRRAVFGDVIGHYHKLAQEGQAICYCASVRHSESMAEAFRGAGIQAIHLDAKTPSIERQREIARFREGRTQILCNVDLISEGFDVPDCGVSILLRPTQSLTIFIQQAMRCMRYRAGKQALIINHVGNYARFGLPDADRNWSLKDKERKPNANQENKEPVRQCPECFYTHEVSATCPNCGYVYPAPDRTPEEIKEAALQRIEGFTLDLQRPEDCHNYEELLAYAKKKNYKPGWAYYQAKQRGMIPA